MIRRRTSSLCIGLVLAIGLVACGEPGVTLSEDLESFPDSPSPTPSAEPTPPASASPSAATSSGPSPTAAAAALEVDGLAEVLVTDLVVRTAPGVEAGTSTILADRLTDGDRLFVVDGPVDAAGYAWYLVAPLARADTSSGPFGWIAAASREGEPWVRSVPPPCPGHVDLAAVLALQPLERLACFGDTTLTLTADAGECGAGGGPWTWDPDWLGVIGGCALRAGDASLLVRVPPGGAVPDTVPVTVRGHFDDPAASRCTVTSADPAIPAPSAEEAVVICRTQFVRES